MINSKRKGKKGELAFCQLCEVYGYEVSRTAQYRGNTGQAGDVEGLAGIHVEVKNQERLNLREAITQSVEDCAAEGKGKLPIVAHKKNREPWLITMRAEDWFSLYTSWLKEGRK